MKISEQRKGIYEQLGREQLIFFLVQKDNMLDWRDRVIQAQERLLEAYRTSNKRVPEWVFATLREHKSFGATPSKAEENHE
jgi:hypothetical protein